jgi:predicted N-acetyltransferase YhbS
MSPHTALIEDTQPEDQPLIDALLDLTFGLSRRIKTSYRLREGSAPAPGLSLVVADEQLGLAGCISFWPLAIGLAATPALLLGPLAVHPERQGLGIGLALMREGLRRAKTMGHRLVILVGDAPYYAKVGFHKLPPDLLVMPGPNNPERFLYLELVPGALKGVSGLVLPPHRCRAGSAALAQPHAAEGEKQRAKA